MRRGGIIIPTGYIKTSEVNKKTGKKDNNNNINIKES